MARTEVEVQVACDDEDVPSPGDLDGWARAALAGEDAGAEVTVRVVGEAEGRQLNEAYRGRSGPTNVLSFPFDAPQATDPPLLGDVVICAPVVRREAGEQGKDSRAHWAHMVVHGALHLRGHDHHAAAEAERMERAERRILARLGFPDPYAGEER